MIPVLDKILCDDAQAGSQHIVGYEVADAEFRHNCFFLPVTGSSMAPRLDEGDLVLIRRQEVLKNGETGVFIVDNQKCIISIFNKGEKLELRSSNPYYPAMSFDQSEQNRVRIIGKVIESRRKW